MLNTDSRRRSAVGRMSRDEGEARLRPFNRPPTTRIRISRHGRACPGHPRLSCLRHQKTWMPGTRPGMTTFPVLTISFDDRTLLVARLQVALAVVAALRTPRRAVA